MTRLRTVKTSFTAGEIAPRLFGRTDLRAHANGARRLENVFIHPTGGLSRRAGLAFVDRARGPGRLVAFAFNTEQTYLLAFSAGAIDVYRDDVRLATVTAPWTEAQLAQIAWTQSADTLLVCHPDVAPRRVTRRADLTWQIDEWSWVVENGAVRQPWYRFAPADVTIAASATTGYVTLVASAAVFRPAHQGTRFRVAGKQVRITAVASGTQATATVEQALAGTAATTAWDEQAFSPVRGWPATAVFHQDRLVVGGSRDLPNRLWLSRSADLWNFDVGTGKDDEAIEFAILSDDVNAIRALFSGRHLQVFTSGAEWMVSGDPLTPGTIQMARQTRVGSPVDRRVPPRNVDGATLYVGRTGADLREFVYTDVEQAYQSPDLALLASHLVDRPRDMDFDPRRRLLFVAMADGSLRALTVYRAEQVTAWMRVTTDGPVRAVAAVGERVYLLVDRLGGSTIEAFDDGFALDAAVAGESGTAKTVWSGLSHLDGRDVAVVADGVPRAPVRVNAGTIVLDAPARRVEAGIPFACVVEPLPALLGTGGGEGLALRVVSATFRLEGTRALRIDFGTGPQDVPLRRPASGGAVLGPDPPPPFTGDVARRAVGWRRDGLAPPWRIEQDLPLPFTLLSVTTILKVND
jgi:hypothetical protein